MMSNELAESREWCGLSAIRSILGDTRRDFVDAFYPTSISDSEFDLYRRIAITAALVRVNRHTIVEALISEVPGRSREERTQAVIRDLDKLTEILRYLVERLEGGYKDVQLAKDSVSRTRNLPPRDSM